MDCLHLHKAAVTALQFVPVSISMLAHSKSTHILASASTDSSIQLIDVSLLSSSSLTLSVTRRSRPRRKNSNATDSLWDCFVS